MKFEVTCSSNGQVFRIEVQAESVEQAVKLVKQMAAEQAIKRLKIVATVQVM
jgi:acetylornithine/succinyldiaminopimelate/putrescine aminotransferase